MSSNVPVCDIDPKARDDLRRFKFGNNKKTAAIVLKVDSAKQMVVVDEEYEDTSIDEVASDLPEFQPRYIVLSYVHKQSDGRTSYPLIFIFCSPQGCKVEDQIMYAGTKAAIVEAAQATKVFDIRLTEDLTERFIEEKLKFFS